MSNLVRSYPVSAGNDAVSVIPNSLMPEKKAQPFPITSKIIEITASNGSSQAASSTITFAVPSSGYLKSGSCYLKAQIVITSASNAAATQLGFCSDGNSIINRATLLCNGVAIETIQNFDVWAKLINEHMTSASYYTNDANIMCSNNLLQTNAATTVANFTFEVNLPLLFGCLISDKHFPLHLLGGSNGLQIQLDLNSAARATFVFTPAVAASYTPPIFSSNTVSGLPGNITTAAVTVAAAAAVAGVSPSTYVVNNPTLSFEHIRCPEYEQGVKAKLMQGYAFQFPFRSVQCLQQSLSGLGGVVQYGLTLQSLDALFVRNVASMTDSSRKDGIYNFTNCRAYIDGNQIVNYNIDTKPRHFSELQRAIGSFSDVLQTSACTSANYAPTFVNEVTSLSNPSMHAVGFNCRRLNEDSLIMTGSPCQNISVNVETANAPANYNTFIFAVYSGLLIIDGNGSVAVKR